MSFESDVIDLLKMAEDLLAQVRGHFETAKVETVPTMDSSTPPAVDQGPSSSDLTDPPAAVEAPPTTNPDGSPLAAPEAPVESPVEAPVESPVESPVEAPVEAPPTTNPDGSPLAAPDEVTEMEPGLSSPVMGTVTDGVFTPSVLP